MKTTNIFIFIFLFFISDFLYGQVREYDFMDKVGQTGYNSVNNPGNYGSDKTDEDPTSQTSVTAKYSNIANGYCYKFYYSMPANTTLGYQYAYAYFYRQSLTAFTTNNYLTAGTNLSFWFKSSSSLIGKSFKFTLKSAKVGPKSKNESYIIITNKTGNWSNVVVPLSDFITAGNRNPFSITNIIGYTISVSTVSTGTICIDRIGFVNDTSVSVGVPDNIGVPTSISSPTVQQISTNIKVQISWGDLSNETSYSLFRNTLQNSNTATNIGGTGADVTIFTDNTVTTNLTYYYWIRGYFDYGFYYTGGLVDLTTNAKFSNYSPTPFSGNSSVYVSGSGSISAPTSIDASAISSNSIYIVWSDVLNETSYTLYRASSNDTNSAVSIAGLNAGNTNYTDTGLTGLTTYYYWVKSYNSTTGQSSSFSVPASARTYGNIEWTYMDKVGQTGYDDINSPANYGSDKEEDSGSQTTVKGKYIDSGGYYYSLTYSLPTNTTLGYQYVYASFKYQSSSSTIYKDVTTWGTNLSIWIKASQNIPVTVKLMSSMSNISEYKDIEVTTDWSNYVLSLSQFSAVSGKNPVDLSKLFNVSLSITKVSSGDLYVDNISFTDDPNSKASSVLTSYGTGIENVSGSITTNIAEQKILTPEVDFIFDEKSFPIANNLISPKIYFYTVDGKLLKELDIGESWISSERANINNFVCIYKIVDNNKIILRGILILAK